MLAVGTELNDGRGGRGVEQALARAAENYIEFLSAHGGSFACMKAFEDQLPVPRVDEGRVPDLFGDIKRFPHMEVLVQILSHGVTVAAGGAGYLRSALQYGNHSLVTPYASTVARPRVLFSARNRGSDSRPAGATPGSYGLPL